MNKTLIGTISFALGISIGAFAAWKLTKTKYEQIAYQEIKDAKEFYKEFYEKKAEQTNTEDVEDELPPLTEDDIIVYEDEEPENEKGRYIDILNENGYRDYSIDTHAKISNIPPPKVAQNRPYVISEDELGECGYEIEYLTYYADEVLTYDDDDIIYEIDLVIGEESLLHFGEEKKDLLHVRNPELQKDYEICLDPRSYSLLVDTGGV